MHTATRLARDPQPEYQSHRIDDVAAPAAPAGPALLAEITASLAQGGDLKHLLGQFLEPVMRLAQARAGAVRVLSADGECFELVSAIGLPAAVVRAERRVTRRCGFCGRCAEGIQVTSTRELSGCARRHPGEFFARECRRAMAVPMQHRGRVLGIYNLFFDGATEEPAPAVLAMLRTVGELLGLALENHRLECENLRVALHRERQAMAAEVHDAVAQNLTFVKMRLPLLRDAIVARDGTGALAFLDDVREAVGEAHGSLREIVTHFRTMADPRGLGCAIGTLAARLRAHTGMEVQLDNRVPQLRLPEAHQAELFHIVQEALANVERHAQAQHCWLSLEPRLHGLEVRIEDDGRGPAWSDAAGDHHGLAIMQERARRLGGELAVGAREGGGTLVRCTLPLDLQEK